MQTNYDINIQSIKTQIEVFRPEWTLDQSKPGEYAVHCSVCDMRHVFYPEGRQERIEGDIERTNEICEMTIFRSQKNPVFGYVNPDYRAPKSTKDIYIPADKSIRLSREEEDAIMEAIVAAERGPALPPPPTADQLSKVAPPPPAPAAIVPPPLPDLAALKAAINPPAPAPEVIPTPPVAQPESVKQPEVTPVPAPDVAALQRQVALLQRQMAANQKAYEARLELANKQIEVERQLAVELNEILTEALSQPEVVTPAPVAVVEQPASVATPAQPAPVTVVEQPEVIPAQPEVATPTPPLDPLVYSPDGRMYSSFVRTLLAAGLGPIEQLWAAGSITERCLYDD